MKTTPHVNLNRKTVIDLGPRHRDCPKCCFDSDAINHQIKFMKKDKKCSPMVLEGFCCCCCCCSLYSVPARLSGRWRGLKQAVLVWVVETVGVRVAVMTPPRVWRTLLDHLCWRCAVFCFLWCWWKDRVGSGSGHRRRARFLLPTFLRTCFSLCIIAEILSSPVPLLVG